MYEAIYRYYPKQEWTYGTGAFRIQRDIRSFDSTRGLSANGRAAVNYPCYKDLAGFVLGLKHKDRYGRLTTYSLFDMLHGDCFYFASSFLHYTEGWRLACLVGRTTDIERLVHAYAYKIGDDGRYRFADVRGETDSTYDFFAEFMCSGKSVFLLDKEHKCIPIDVYDKNVERDHPEDIGFHEFVASHSPALTYDDWLNAMKDYTYEPGYYDDITNAMKRYENSLAFIPQAI